MTALKEIVISESIKAIDQSLYPYCRRALQSGITHAKQVHTSSIVTGKWVRLKCQFGCNWYGNVHCCPPDSPTPDETREILDSYQRAILFHIELPYSEEWHRVAKKTKATLVDLEGQMFKDGYYRAFVLLGGHCTVCEECAKRRGEPCVDRGRARPAMEACGIDVYQTAKNNGFQVQPLKEKGERLNLFRLMLVD